MINLLLEPLNYAFMVRGLIATALVGIICSVIGTFIVLRGMAFFGDALSHTILPGVAAGYLFGGGAGSTIFWWALGTAIISALSIGAISRGSKIKEDTAIGIIFAGMFALGIALISTVKNYSVDLVHFLFGNVLAVTMNDLLLIIFFGGAILIIILAFYKEFMVISFDPVLAVTLRMPARLLEYILLILVAVTIVVSLQTVGVALMVAMLVTPAATAFLLAKRLPAMMALAALIGSLSGVLGLYISYYSNIASGSAIVLVATMVFLITFILVPRRKTLLTRTKQSPRMQS
ncbi:MAG: metal ABC transporter permease [Anaerolineaceae bacterium]|nr:metal ABC transporter permease [Anaerolineaceae bacterium]